MAVDETNGGVCCALSECKGLSVTDCPVSPLLLVGVDLGGPRASFQAPNHPPGGKTSIRARNHLHGTHVADTLNHLVLPGLPKMARVAEKARSALLGRSGEG